MRVLIVIIVTILYTFPVGFSEPYDTRCLLALVGLAALTKGDYRKRMLRPLSWQTGALTLTAVVIACFIPGCDPLQTMLTAIIALLGCLGLFWIVKTLLEQSTNHYEPVSTGVVLVIIVSLIGSLTGWYDVSRQLQDGVIPSLCLLLLGMQGYVAMPLGIVVAYGIIMVTGLYYNPIVWTGIVAGIVFIAVEKWYNRLTLLYPLVTLLLYEGIVIGTGMDGQTVIQTLPIAVLFIAIADQRNRFLPIVRDKK